MEEGQLIQEANGHNEETRGDRRSRPERPGGMQARARQGLPPRGLRVRQGRRRRVESDAGLHEAADAGVGLPVLRLPVAGVAASAEGLFPRHDEVVEYLSAYARRFGILERVRFDCKVLGASYVGATEQEVAAWERWSGNGEAFGDGTGEWHLTVRHGDGEPEGGGTQV